MRRLTVLTLLLLAMGALLYGKDAYRKNYEEFLAQFDGPIKVEFRGMKIVAGGNVAYVYTLEHFEGRLKNGQPLDMWGRCTSGFQKIKGQWLDSHDHCSVPADFDSGKAALDLKPRWETVVI